MNILTFDTSLDSMHITLSTSKENIDSRIVNNKKGKYHSAFIIPTIIELLKAHAMTMQDIEAIGVNIGPGSFTGIRACVTVARVCAQMLKIPLIGISSLEILSKINQSDKQTLCLMDARKNKAYTALFDKNENKVIEPQAYELEQAIALAKENNYFIVCDSKMQKLLADNQIECTNYQENDYDFGAYLAELTYKYLDKGGDFNWAKLKPLYIQPPPISMPKKK